MYTLEQLKAPLKISIIYCLVGILWILLSDRFLLVFLTKNELLSLTYLQTVKGFFYVFSTSALLYSLIRSNDQKQRLQIQSLEELNANLIQQREINEKTHHELEESEKRYSNLFQICPLPMWVFDSMSYKFLDVNISAITHYGYTREEFLEMTIMDIRPENEVGRVKNVLSNTLEGKDPFYKGVFHHIKKDKTLIEVEIRSDFFDFKGNKARIVLINDVTELLKTQRSLKEAYDSIIHLEDKERERFAGELHDGISQNLVALKHFLSMVDLKEGKLNENPIFSILEELVDNTIKECRQIIYDMRPKMLYDGGLVLMLKSMCDKLNMAGGIHIDYCLDEKIDHELPISTKFHVYRMIQENFNNTLKYAHAQHVNLKMTCGRECLMIYFSDDGVGMSPEIANTDSTFLGIKHRLVPINGTFNVETCKEGGVKFIYNIPIDCKGSTTD